MYLTILAIVQMRWRSSGSGSSTSACRCSKIPTGRCSRSACCAAAIDFGRAIVIGAITAGNSTILRTGRMIRASPGIDTDSVVELAAETGASLSGGMITSQGLRQAQHDTSIRSEAADHVSSRRQYDAAFEPALWKLKPVDAS